MSIGKPYGLCNVVVQRSIAQHAGQAAESLSSTIIVLLCWYESNSCVLQAKQAQLVSSR